MSKTYTPADFTKPKVCGLAIHNATLMRNRSMVEREERDVTQWIVPPEVMSYCLFAVTPTCSVIPLAGAPTAGDFAPLVKSSNLALLAKKYGAIGFVTLRRPSSEEKWGILEVPKK